MIDSSEYRLERFFNAPKALVWRAWTDPAILNRWYGPGVETTIHEFDLRPGGLWLNEMNWGGKSNYQKMQFQEVVDEEKIVWMHHSCTDENWLTIKNPMMPDWPSLLLTTVTFTQQGEQTLVTLSQVPYEASETEKAFFAEAMSNQDKGWGSGYAILDDILAELG